MSKRKLVFICTGFAATLWPATVGCSQNIAAVKMMVKDSGYIFLVPAVKDL